ncbi:MAG: osmotically inducible protein OsmC [Herbaspirillum sp.]|jgi:putative redox protein|nr:osmotically inducible protein OsmC [Herbaspirillum sp.]
MDVSTAKGQGKLQHIINIGKHRVLTDASVEHGGEGSGPDPHDLLAAALAACTVMTLKLYAQRKQMDLQDVEVRIQHRQEEDAYIFMRSIRYIGNVNEAQRTRLTEIAEKCPVHKTLLGQIRIVTQVTD